MTLIFNHRVPHVQREAVIVRFGAKIFSLVTELRRRRDTKKKLADLSPRDLQDIGLTPNDMQAVCARPLARDAATQLHYIAHLRCGDR